MTDELKLLPCPFCGGPVQLEKAHQRRHEQFGMRQFWGVVCRNTTNLGGTCCMEQVPSASPEAAVARWNRRTTQPAPIPVQVGEVLTSAEITQLANEHDDREYGLQAHPFARAIEAVVASRCRAQGGNTQSESDCAAIKAGGQGGEDGALLDWLEANCAGASDSERYLPFRVYWGNKGATKGIRAVLRAAIAAKENSDA